MCRSLASWFTWLFPQLYSNEKTFLARVRRNCIGEDGSIKINLEGVQTLNSSVFLSCSVPMEKVNKKHKRVASLQIRSKKAKLLHAMSDMVDEMLDLEGQEEEKEDADLKNLSGQELKDKAREIFNLLTSEFGGCEKMDDEDLRDLIMGIRYCHSLFHESIN